MKRFFLFFISFFLWYVQLNAQPKNFQLSQFTFEDTTGKKYNLESLKGKVVFVDCWFPGCPPCRQEMPYSQLLQRRLHAIDADSNIVFVTISFKQSVQEWLNALSKLQMPKAIHLYSQASTYEMTLSWGNYPSYRIFDSNGSLDIYDAPRPSDIGKIDFVLFAAAHKISVKESLELYATEFEGGKNFNTSFMKNSIAKKFAEKFFQKIEEFNKEYLQLGRK